MYTKVCCYFLSGLHLFLLFLVGVSIACGVRVVCDHIGGIECTATSPGGWVLLRNKHQSRDGDSDIDRINLAG